MSFRRWRPSSRRDRRQGSRRRTQSTRDDVPIFVVIGLFVLGVAALLVLLIVLS